MTRVSRARRYAETWLGPSLATLVGIASTVELAAMPIPAPGAQLPGPTLIQQSPGPQGVAQQPARTPRPPSAGEGKPDSFIELQESLTAAREGLEGLSKVAKALAATKQLQQEFAALQKENQKLRAEIEASIALRTAARAVALPWTSESTAKRVIGQLRGRR